MNWLKVAAVAVGALIAFFIVSSVVGVIIGLAFKVLIAALVIGAIAVGIKAVGGRRRIGRRASRRALRRDYQDYEERDRGRHRSGYERRDNEQPSREQPEPPRRARPPQQAGAVQPWQQQAASGDVEDELSRLKREMGR